MLLSKYETKSDSETNEKDSQINDQKNNCIIKELQEENKKLIDNQIDSKHIIEIISKSNKQLSPSPLNKESNVIVMNLTELEESKIEIKRLKDSLEKLKSTVGSSSNHSISISRTIMPIQQILISSPTNITTSPSNSTPSSLTKVCRDFDHEKLASNINLQNTSLPSVEPYVKKIKGLEDSIRELHKNLNNKKQEESALLTDMEITGQAFEDMQVKHRKIFKKIQNLFMNFFKGTECKTDATVKGKR